MGTCKLRDHEARLIRAHIVPASFYRDTNISGGPMLVVGPDPTYHTQRSQIGIYDTGILCESCERSLAPYDDYGADLLINRRDSAFQLAVTDGNLLFVAQQFDYAKLRLFIISVLWRASVSSQQVFRNVSLGRFEQRAKEMILQCDPGDPDVFSTVLSRWTVPARASVPPKYMGSPVNVRLDKIRCARLYLGAFVADTSLESRPLSRPFQDVAIRPQAPLLAVARDLYSSEEYNSGVRRIAGGPRRNRR